MSIWGIYIQWELIYVYKYVVHQKLRTSYFCVLVSFLLMLLKNNKKQLRGEEGLLDS